MSSFSDSAAEWLSGATAKFAVQVSGEQSSLTPSAGDIVRLDPMDFDGIMSALGLIKSVDRVLGIATVNLLSNETEMAGANDVLVSSTESGLPYDLIVQEDIIGQVWLAQIGRQLGRLDLSNLCALARGTEVRGPQDARWPWKEDQLSAFEDLAGDCIRELFNSDFVPIIDPGMVQDSERDLGETASITLQIIDLMRDHLAMLPVSALFNDDHRPAPDARVALETTLMMDPSYGWWASANANQDSEVSIPDRCPTTNDALPAIIAAQRERGHHSITLLTDRRLWRTGDTTSEVLGIYVGKIKDSRCQIVAIPLLERG